MYLLEEIMRSKTKTRFLTSLIFLVTILAGRALAATGDLDQTFGNLGKVTTQFNGGNACLMEWAIHPAIKLHYRLMGRFWSGESWNAALTAVVSLHCASKLMAHWIQASAVVAWQWPRLILVVWMSILSILSRSQVL